VDPEDRPSCRSSDHGDGSSCWTSFDKGQRYHLEAMTEFGADGYLAKPIDPELLATALRALVATPENP
jgi:DNA-binding NarL/FixJ family response regulator